MSHEHYLNKYAGEKEFVQNIGLPNRPQTETQQQFAWKITQFSTVRNPDALKIHYVKPFAETFLSNRPKLKQPVSSLSHTDYNSKTRQSEEFSPAVQFATETEGNTTTSHKIDLNKGNFGKLLHPSATTNNLTYRAHYLKEVKRDAITFWNWKNSSPKTKPSAISSQIPIDYRNTLQHVPHTGLTTETSSNYLNLNPNEFGPPMKANQCIEFVDKPNDVTSENAVYGSGTRIQKYCN